MADALWAYGVLEGSRGAPDVAGIDGAPVTAVAGAGLVALVSRVPLPRFAEEGLRVQLEDLPRVEELARAHEGVLHEAFADGPVVPFRLCTIYESEASVASMLEREREVLVRALELLAGKAEWGVKVLQRALAPAAAPSDVPTSGTDYLARKRAAREAAEQARETGTADAADIHARLADAAVAAALGRPQDRRLSGHEGEMLLNASYLVEDDARFHAVLEELAERHEADGLTFELTGPWPPYHFTEELRS